MNNPDQTYYIPASGILFTEDENELVLFDPERGLADGVYVLNDIGARIWQLINKCGYKAHIAEQLLKEYEVDALIVNTALDELIRQLVDNGFLIAIPREVAR